MRGLLCVLAKSLVQGAELGESFAEAPRVAAISSAHSKLVHCDELHVVPPSGCRKAGKYVSNGQMGQSTNAIPATVAARSDPPVNGLLPLQPILNVHAAQRANLEDSTIVAEIKIQCQQRPQYCEQTVCAVLVLYCE